MARYHRASDLADALAVLTTEGSDARVLVGGTDLLVKYRHRTVEPRVFVDIKAASDLPPPIAVDDDRVRFGPTATMMDLSRHPEVRGWFPALVEAADVVGSVAIRNRATVVGNLCNASPAADTAPALLVHGATVDIAGGAGRRTVPLQEFFTGPRTTIVGPGELVTGVTLPRPGSGTSSAFRRLTRRLGVDLASVSVAAAVDADDHVTIGLGAVGPTPLVGHSAGPVDWDDADAVDAAVAALVEVATPITDVRASDEYRTAMVAVLAGRAVRTAAGRRTPEEAPR